MDIPNHSVPYYFKYLLLRYHSLVHFIQSKLYNTRLFEKTLTFTNNLILCNIPNLPHLLHKKETSLSLWQLSEINQKTWAQT